MMMVSEYDETGWREVMHRLSVHLDRPYDEPVRHQDLRARAAAEAWTEYLDLIRGWRE